MAVLRLADYSVARRGLLGFKPIYCDLCGFPAVSAHGLATHHGHCHSSSELADRNWEIFYGYIEEGKSASQLADTYGLSIPSIHRIIQRGLTFPGIYELGDFS